MQTTHRVRGVTHTVWWVGGLYSCHSFTSMAYEVVWISLMAASVGRTLAAMGTVLLVCTAGLGLGAAAMAWGIRRYTVSTRWLFVAVQIALGLGGTAFPWLLHEVDRLYVALAPPAESVLHHGLRLAISAALLLPLACLIGAVFPLLSASAKRRQSGATGDGLGRLYRCGLFWSGLGALATPLGLLPLLGFTRTSLLLGLLNGLAALGGLRLSDLPRPNTPLAPCGGEGRGEGTAHSLVCGLSAILGGSLFAVESIGAQYLWLIVDATVYAEGLLLGTVLLGMSAGAAAYAGLRRLHRRRDCVGAGQLCCPSPEVLLLGALLLFALSLALWLLLAAEVAAAFEALLRWTVQRHAAAVGFFTVHGLLVLVVLGGPAGATGLGFPALCALAIRRHGTITNAVGRVTAWHYVGAGIGAVGASFLLLPRLGMTWSLVVLSVMLLLTAAWWAASLPWERGRRWLWGGLGVALAALCWLGGSGDVTFRTRAAGGHNRVVLHHEDGTGIVEVYEDQHTGHRVLLSSRLRQEGGDRPEDLRVQRLQGALPVLLHPAPSRLLVVGLGTGISLAASLRPEVEQATCVELSRGVMRAAALFDQAHDRVLAHPKVTLVHQDGRNFLSLTREHYDLIVQDLFFPYRAGVGTLYTLEHYQRIRARLAPHGRVAQWIALNQVGPLELRVLAQTFTTVFPHTSVWLTGGYLLLYGGLEPLTLSWPAFQQRLATVPPVDETTSADVLGMFVSTGEALQPWLAGAPLNTDDNAWIEFRAPRAFTTLNSVALAVENLAALLPLQRPVTVLLTALPAADRELLEHASEAARLLWNGIIARAQGDLERARQLYTRAHALNPVNYQMRNFLEQDGAARGREALLAGRLADAEALLRRVLALNPRHAQAQFDLAVLHVQRQEHAVAATLFAQLLRQHPEFPQAHFNLGVSLYRLGRYAEAAAQFARVVARDPTAVEATFNLANSLAQAGQYAEAVQWYQRTLILHPQHQLARDNLQAIHEWSTARR